MSQFRNPAAGDAGPGVPEALPRALAALAGRLDPASLERIWIFPPLVRGRREWGLVAASCAARPGSSSGARGVGAEGVGAEDVGTEEGEDAAGNDAPKEDGRTLYTVPYAAERSGRGLYLDVTLREQGQAPHDRLPRVMDGVARRSGDDLGDPREVRIDGDPARFAELMDEFDAALFEEPSQPMQASET